MDILRIVLGELTEVVVGGSPGMCGKQWRVRIVRRASG